MMVSRDSAGCTSKLLHNYTDYWLRAHPGTSPEASQALGRETTDAERAWLRCGYLPNFLSTSV